MKITQRTQFPELLKSLNLWLPAVEVGVAEGFNAWNLLDNWGGQVSLVDPWAILDEPGFSGHGENTQAGQDERYHRILLQAQKYGDRCKVLRMTSEQAAPRFEDGSLHFIYLDAQHDYDSIKRDIELWLPKMRLNGIFAGHDYIDGPVHNGSQQYGVKRAVTEFANQYGKEVNVTSERDWPSWWVQI